MKIAVVCLASRSGGGLTILEDLFSFASATDTSNEWLFVLSDQNLQSGISRVRVMHTTATYRGIVWRFAAEFTSGRKAISRFEPDVVLSLQNIDTPARGRRPLAIYMHQALPFADVSFSPFKRSERSIAVRQILLGRLIRGSVARAQVTFVQTKWIADAVSQACPGVNVKNIGYRLPYIATPPKQTSQQTTCFVYPASDAIYKDHITLRHAIKLWHSWEPNAGKVALTLTQDTFERIVGSLPADEARWYDFIGLVPAGDLAKLYAKSILIFPSYLETLGLPLYEARAHGCRIVAADTPHAREALDGYRLVHYATARSSQELALAMSDAWKLRNVRDVSGSGPSHDAPTPQSPWDMMLHTLGEIIATK